MLLHYSMNKLITTLDAAVGVELWMPGATEASLGFGLTENSIKRVKQRIINPTERSYSALPAFGRVYARPWYRWELNQVCYQQELLQLEDLITAADEWLTHETQQYLILYDYSGWINITDNPIYESSVINPETNQVIDGYTYAQCAHNVYVESLEVDSSYAHLEALCSFTLILNEVI